MYLEITQRIKWHEKFFAGLIITYTGFIITSTDYSFHNKLVSSVTDEKLTNISFLPFTSSLHCPTNFLQQGTSIFSRCDIFHNIIFFIR